jgi:L-fucose isomerase-like protein
MFACPMNRRQFAGLTVAGIAGGALGLRLNRILGAENRSDLWNPDRPLVVTGRKLKVQPVLMYTTFQRREATSWRSWGSINSKQAAAEEMERIGKELATLSAGADFPLEVLPLVAVTSVEEAQKLHQNDYDVIVIYPATGSGGVLRACFAAKQPRDTLIFARHQSGPTYYWYEALSTGYLKKETEPELAQNTAANHGPVTIHDVVIDDYRELRWRLRALYAVKNFIGQRIVALGGAQGKYDAQAPKVARDRYHLNIIDVTYDDLTKRLEKLRADAGLVAQAEKWTERYLAIPGTTLATKKPFVVNAFLLYVVFKDWMREHNSPAFTIQACMGTVIPLARTTACLTLSWLNDEGLLAFCESDFVIIPAGIFLHYISGKPVFLHNSTFPHQAVVTCAHCTGPRRMDGKKYEPAKITTHYESDYGAAPKVEIPIGQQVTFIDPEYATGRWVGMKGIVKANPSHEICRSQQDVEIQGDWKKLLAEARDSHWMMVYGDHLQELGYAARKIGINWVDISTTA